MTTTLLPFQKEDLDRLDPDFGGRCLVCWQMGLGKAQPLAAKILTPDGWTRMEKVRPGDMVIGGDGRPVKVTGVYDRGIRKVYRVRFRDGAVVECCNDHLWAVRSAGERCEGKPARVLPLSTIRQKLHDTGSGRKNSNYFIPIVGDVQFTPRPVPVDPYLLGYLLANGCLRHGVEVSIPDQETVDRVEELVSAIGICLRKDTYRPDSVDYALPKAGKRRHGPNLLRDQLRDLGLFGLGSWQKFIPSAYRHNSQEVRLAVFQGLMDGDGWCSGGVLGYESTSKKLAKHVRGLIRSFGGVATMRSRVPRFTYRGKRKVGRRCYSLTICLPDWVRPFRLSRKAEKYQPRTKYRPCRAITEVTYVGKKRCQCISVDAVDGLYVTDNYIVTHNTVAALFYAQRHPELRPVVVVCPASLKWQWEREAKRHVRLRAEVLEGTRPRHGGLLRAPLYIVNYDILGPWLPHLQRLNPQLLVLDEGHYVANRKAARSRCAAELAAAVPRLLVLTGTPLMNRPAELWHLLHLLRPAEYPSFWSYAREFCSPKHTRWGWDVSGASNLGVLHRRLKGVMLRRRKQDVIHDLPAKRRIVLPLPITDPKEYERASTDFLGWLREQDPARVRRALRAEALVRATALKKLAAHLKLPAVREWVDNFLEDDPGKMILFTTHKDVLEELHDRYRGRSVVVDGSVTGHRRQLAVDQFQKHKGTRLFLGNLQAACEGLNLTAARTVAFVEYGWNPTKHLQGEERSFARLNDMHGADIYWLVARDTIEERLVELLQRKQQTFDKVVDGEGGGEKLSVFDDLVAELLREAKERRRR